MMGLLTRRTGNSTHPGPAYTSSAHAARPTHPSDSYYAYPSHSMHPTCLYPTDPAEPYPIHPAGPYPTQSTSSYDLSSSSVDIQGVPIPAEVACPTLRTPQFTVGDLYGKKWRRTTIEMLPEDILLKIFDFYRLNDMELLWGRPWKWHHLA